MYEKKINIFNDIDRKIFNTNFKYIVVFLIIMLIITFILILWKKDYYYENIISFLDNTKASILVDKEYFNMLESKKIRLNDGDFDYVIDKVEERENDYILNIHFNNEISVKTPIYKILLKKESLLEYILRIIKGD